MSTSARFLGIGVAFGLAAGVLAGVGLTQPGRAAATTPSAAPNAPAVGTVGTVGAAGGAPAAGAVTANGATVVSSGPAIASYPYFAGAPGLAPDHTIVVTGTGQANLAADGSGQAAAQKSALGAALADAKTQAAVIAADTGLSISGVLSVSASVSPNYGVEPMIANGSSGPACVVPVPGSGPQASSGIVAPQPACLPQPIYQQTISVSVTVAYSVG